MNELFFVRIFAYSILPLLLAFGHMRLDKRVKTGAQRIELVVIYLLAISVGANGIGGAYGHLFLSDLVAEGIGWSAGSPFQLEMGFANLAIGVLGLMAIGRKGDFRMAAIIATTIIGVGATSVHLLDIAAHGNLAPGNTIQNIGNLLDPVLLISLSWWSTRLAQSATERVKFDRWQLRQQPIAGFAAFGLSVGFGFGFAVASPLLWTIVGTLIGIAIGVRMSRRLVDEQISLAMEHE
jgi:hypothetical protein